MEKVNGGTLQPPCMLAHHLINRLSVIVGYCDLLIEESSKAPSPDPKGARRLMTMREIAGTAAEELIQHQCRVEAVVRNVAPAADPASGGTSATKAST